MLLPIVVAAFLKTSQNVKKVYAKPTITCCSVPFLVVVLYDVSRYMYTRYYICVRCLTSCSIIAENEFTRQTNGLAGAMHRQCEISVNVDLMLSTLTVYYGVCNDF